MNKLNKFNTLDDKVMFGNFLNSVFGNIIIPNDSILFGNFHDIIIHNTSLRRNVLQTEANSFQHGRHQHL